MTRGIKTSPTANAIKAPKSTIVKKVRDIKTFDVNTITTPNLKVDEKDG